MTFDLALLLIIILNLSMMCLCFKAKKDEIDGKKAIADWTFLVSSLLTAAPALYISRVAFGFNSGKRKFFTLAIIPLIINVVIIALMMIYIVEF
ncbi:MAG: hypothetical protein R3Y23_03100 [Bacillota bacterium]